MNAPTPRNEPRDDAIFRALADGRRRDILRAVAAQGDVTATELANGMPVSRQAVSKHLSLLADVGLISPRHVGRETRWHFDPTPLDLATAWITQVSQVWDSRLARLAERLAEEG